MVAITDFSAWGLLLISLLTAVPFFSPQFRAGKLRYFCPMLWFGLAFLMFHIFAPFNILITGRIYNAKFCLDDFNRMTLASIFGGWAFFVGWFLKRCFHRANKGSSGQASQKLPGYRTRAVVLLPVAVTPIFVYWFRRELIGPGLVNIFSLGMGALAAFILLLHAKSQMVQGGYRLLYCLVTAGSGVIYLAMVLQLEARLRVLLLIVPWLALSAFSARRVRFARFIAIAIPLVVLLSAFGRARLRATTPGEYVAEIRRVLSGSVTEVYARLDISGDLDAFENGMHVLHYVPSHYPLLHGATFLSVLYNPIPRMLWPGKPSPATTDILVDLGIGRGEHVTNFAIALIAESYANFWWPGVILITGALGYLSAVVWGWTLRNRHDPGAWLHVGLYDAFLILVMRGSFHAMTIYYLMVLIWILSSARVVAWLKVIAPRSKRGAHRLNRPPQLGGNQSK